MSKKILKKSEVINVPEWRKAVESICRELQWQLHLQQMDDFLMIICPLPNDAYFSGVLFVISDVTHRLMMSVSYRTKATKDCKAAMIEVISQINFGLLGGCLELDQEHGEVRYRDGLFLFNAEVNPELLRAFVATTLKDALRYYPEIESMVSGNSKDLVK